MATFLKTIPLLVQDAGLSEALTIDTNGDTVLRVSPTDAPAAAWTSAQAAAMTTDVQDIKTNIGPIHNNPPAYTIQSRLKFIDSGIVTSNVNAELINNTLGNLSSTPPLNTLQSRVKSIQDATGTSSDPDTAETVIGLLKSIVSNLS